MSIRYPTYKAIPFTIPGVLRIAWMACAGGALALGACADDTCAGTLSKFCSACPGSEQAARDQASLACRGSSDFPYATAGQCGDFRYVHHAGGFAGETYYFDSQDQLVGAHLYTDTPTYCDGTSLTIDLGLVPDCNRQDEIDLCQAP